MVLPGQFLERPTLIPTGRDGKTVLEGVSHRGTRQPPLLIIPPPPAEGGMDHVVAAEVAWAAAQSGRPTLRFNFRGVGASQGKQGDAKSRLVDIEAAMQVLEENAGGAGVAALAIGGSAQSAVQLVAKHRSITGLAMVTPRDFEPSELIRV